MGMDLARHKSLLSEAQARVRQTGFLRRLPPALQEQVLEGARLVEYPAGGSMIYRDERRRPALLAWGLLRSYLTWRDDRQLTLVYHRPGDLLEVLRVRGELVSEGLQAIEPSGVLQLDLDLSTPGPRSQRAGDRPGRGFSRSARPRLQCAGPADLRHRQAAGRRRPAREGRRRDRVTSHRPRAQGQRSAARRRDRLRPRGGGPGAETAPLERCPRNRGQALGRAGPGGAAARSRSRLTCMTILSNGGP